MPSKRSPSQRTPEARQGRQMAAQTLGSNAGRLISASRRTIPVPSQSSTSGTTELVSTVSASGAAVTLVDVTQATIHYVTLTANCTFTFPDTTPGASFTLVLVQDGTGSRTVTWPAAVKWAGGTAPTLTTTASKRDVFSFMCADGSTWIGFTAGQNYS